MAGFGVNENRVGYCFGKSDLVDGLRTEGNMGRKILKDKGIGGKFWVIDKLIYEVLRSG